MEDDEVEMSESSRTTLQLPRGDGQASQASRDDPRDGQAAAARDDSDQQNGEPALVGQCNGPAAQDHQQAGQAAQPDDQHSEGRDSGQEADDPEWQEMKDMISDFNEGALEELRLAKRRLRDFAYTADDTEWVNHKRARRVIPNRR